VSRFEYVAGFILAGGPSSRMGRDKALLEIAGVPLLARTARLLEPLVGSVTVVGSSSRYAALGLAVVDDDQPGQGPLGGMATALRISACDWNLVVACDLPYLNAPWLRYLIARAIRSGADALLPVSFDEVFERFEPLCAMYHRRCLPAMLTALERGVRKVTDGLRGPPAAAIERVEPEEWKPFDSAGGLFKNMNTPADYQEALARLGGATP